MHVYQMSNNVIASISIFLVSNFYELMRCTLILLGIQVLGIQIRKSKFDLYLYMYVLVLVALRILAVEIYHDHKALIRF